MRPFSLIASLLVAVGCQSKNQHIVVVEKKTPIVGPNGLTVEGLGIETLGGVFTPIINSGVLAPCSVSEVFSTAADGQTRIMVTLFRGTNRLTMANHSLGRFQVVGIQILPRGVPKVEITFKITETQILLFARDVDRKKELQIRRAEEDLKE